MKENLVHWVECEKLRKFLKPLFWIRNELPVVIFHPIYWMYFKFHKFPWNKGWRVFGFPILKKENGSVINMGENLTMRSLPRSNSIGVFQPVILRTIKPDACLRIGNNVGVSGCSIVVANLVEIGDNVLIGSGTLIIDSDLHSNDPYKRVEQSDCFDSLPVKIDRDVFVGARTIILKGVTIGEGAIIGAGAVVVHDVEPFTIVAGNPARLVRTIKKSVT